MLKRMIFAALVLCALGPSRVRADERSEQAAADLLHRRLQNEDPEQVKLLNLVHGKDVVVVQGSMDHIESVLNAARIQHTVLQADKVASYPLRSNMIVMIDCPGTLPDDGVRRIERFVRAGGLLYTTDWALKGVIEKAFPNTIASTGTYTASEVVPVQIDSTSDNLMSRMLLRKQSKPEWWLEGGSFPIKVLDPQRVQVLAHSNEMKAKYGQAPIVVRFKWEDGEVIHVVSHFYRQMATTGPQVASSNAVGGFDGLSANDKKEVATGAYATVPVSEVESSYAFQRMTTNLVTGKQKRNVELDGLYKHKVKAPISLRSAPAASAAPVAAPETKNARLRVLEDKGKQVKVRDDEGNEGWIERGALE